VSSVSRLQKTIAMSTTEAEYVTVTKACKELIWLKDFSKELGKEQEALSLHSDSQSAIDLANDPVYHDRTKHIDVRYHFICKLLKDGVFSLLKIHTSQNLTDMLTKVVTVEKLKSCLVSVGLQAWVSEFESLRVTISRELEKKRYGMLLLMRRLLISKWEIVEVVEPDCRP